MAYYVQMDLLDRIAVWLADVAEDGPMERKSTYIVWHLRSGNAMGEFRTLDEALDVVRKGIAHRPEDREWYGLEAYDGTRSYVLGQEEVLARAVTNDLAYARLRGDPGKIGSGPVISGGWPLPKGK